MGIGVKVPRKKKAIPRRIKTGIAAAPIDKGFSNFKYYVHYDLEKKEISEIMKSYVKANYSKTDAANILAAPEYHFHVFSHIAAGIHWIALGQEFPDNWKHFPERIKEFFDNLIEVGAKALSEKKADTEEKQLAPVKTIQDKIREKINNTIQVDIDEIEDAWVEGAKAEAIDVYERMRIHGLGGQAVEPVRKRLEGWLLDYEDAYHKRCEQAVEGYSHLKRTELKRRIDVTKSMLSDLDKFKAASKAVRKTRTPKAKSADKQVAKMLYLKESPEFKIVSINPMLVIGAMRLLAFNAKTRTLTEYVSRSTKGFTVKGTTLQEVDEDASRQIRLRKPEEFLPIALTKTPKQIENAWKSLTTKESKPNGRINRDTVLLRVLDR